MANRQTNKLSKKKLTEAIQAFYDKAILDPHIQQLISELSKYPTMDKEFKDAHDNIYTELDRMCQEEIRNRLNKESKK